MKLDINAEGSLVVKILCLNFKMSLKHCIEKDI